MNEHKIIIIFPFVNTNKGGSFQSSKLLSHYLDDSSHNISTKALIPIHAEFNRDDKLKFYFDEIIYYKLSKRAQKKISNSVGLFKKIFSINSHLYLFMKAIRLLKKLNVDITHVNDDSAILTWGLASKFLGINVIWHVRQLNGNKYLDFFRKKIANYIIFNSLSSTKRFKNRTKNSAIIHNFFESKKTSEKLSLSCNIDFTKYFVIGFSGSLNTNKRPEWILRLAEDLSIFDNRVIILISGKDYSKGYYTNLIKEYNSLGFSIKIIYLDFVDEMSYFYNTIDVLCSTSIKESFGRVLVEAMIHGKPVISTNSGGPSEIIDDGVNGYIVDVDDYDSFFSKTHHLINNKEKILKMSENASITGNDYLDNPYDIDRLFKIYNYITRKDI